jgi:hypothetical protein
MQDYKIEFPCFTDMPSMPLGFEDNSWHNDAMPSFVSEAQGLIIWVDYLNPADREFSEANRFIVARYLDENFTDDVLLATNDWQAVLAFVNAWRIAQAFAETLKKDLEPRQFAEMKKRNLTYGEGICASHDFCDANMMMAAAFKEVTGREADVATDADTALWNQAWDLARKQGMV